MAVTWFRFFWGSWFYFWFSISLFIFCFVGIVASK
jgi:hypothetical protein